MSNYRGNDRSILEYSRGNKLYEIDCMLSKNMVRGSGFSSIISMLDDQNKLLDLESRYAPMFYSRIRSLTDAMTLLREAL